MGSIVSAVTSVVTQGISLAKGIIQENTRVRNRALRKESQALGEPIVPPSFYPDIESRRKHVPEGPYSVEGIQSSLAQGVLPVGYALDQLAAAGFSTEVAAYKRKVESDKKATQQSFADVLTTLVKAVESELTGPNRGLAASLRKAGVTELTVTRFKNLAKKAAAGQLEVAAVNSAVSELRSLLQTSQVFEDNRDLKNKLNDDVAAASAAKGAGLLSIFHLALAAHHPEVKTSTPTVTIADE